MFLKRLTFGDEARNKKQLSKNQKLHKKQVKLLLNDNVCICLLKKVFNFFALLIDSVETRTAQNVPF